MQSRNIKTRLTHLTWLVTFALMFSLYTYQHIRTIIFAAPSTEKSRNSDVWTTYSVDRNKQDGIGT